MESVAGGVGVGRGLRETRGEGGDAQHAAAVHHDLPCGVFRGAGVDEGDTARRSREGDDIALRVGVGVSLGGDDDAEGVFGPDLERGAAERAGGGGPEKGQDVVLEAREHDLRLGIAEAGVVLEYARSGWRKHDADKKCATEVDALVGDGVDRRADDLAVDLVEQGGRDDLSRGVSAHAAGVRARVAVADALVVLRSRQDHVVAARDDDEDGGLLAGEAVLDEDLRSEI